jgi:hypothetical protein
VSALLLAMVKHVALTGALLALGSLILAGCLDHDAVPADTGIKGTVEMEGGPPEVDGPLSGLAIEVRKGSEEGPVVATRRSDADGAFTIDVPPGDYFVVALYKDGSTAKRAAVTTGAYTTVELVFRAK